MTLTTGVTSTTLGICSNEQSVAPSKPGLSWRTYHFVSLRQGQGERGQRALGPAPVGAPRRAVPVPASAGAGRDQLAGRVSHPLRRHPAEGLGRQPNLGRCASAVGADVGVADVLAARAFGPGNLCAAGLRVHAQPFQSAPGHAARGNPYGSWRCCAIPRFQSAPGHAARGNQKLPPDRINLERVSIRPRPRGQGKPGGVEGGT
jgi:hypothetical protein